MYKHTIVRQIDAPLDFAFSWLTDYQGDDMVLLGGGKPGARKIERIAPNQLHLRNNFLKTKYFEDIVVTLFPPDRWEAKGSIMDREKPLANFTQKFKLEPVSQGGSKYTMALEIEPLTLVARIYAFFRMGSGMREVERQNDMIALGIANYHNQSAKAKSDSGNTI